MLKSKIRQKNNQIRYWWLSILAGTLSIATGVWCMVTPLGLLMVMEVPFVAFLMGGGMFNIVFAMANRNRIDYWGWNLARGIVETLFGIWLCLPSLPLKVSTLILIIGFWMFFHSIIGICESCELQRYKISGWGWLLGCNISSLLCSLVYLATPVRDDLFIIYFIAVSFILYGIFRIVLAIKGQTEREPNLH